MPSRGGDLADARVELGAIGRDLGDVREIVVAAAGPAALPRSFPQAAADAAGGREREASEVDVVIGEPRHHRDRGGERERGPLADAAAAAALGRHEDRHGDGEAERQQDEGRPDDRRGAEQHAGEHEIARASALHRRAGRRASPVISTKVVHTSVRTSAP